MLRYLLVGAWNTLFGFGMYSLLTFLFTGIVPYPYMMAGALAHVINVTAAFLSYKHFVFRAAGSLLRQYVRCQIVYGSTFLVNFALLPILVAALQFMVGPRQYVPYVAGGVLTLGTALIGFFAHKHYSFASPLPKTITKQALDDSAATSADATVTGVE